MSQDTRLENLTVDDICQDFAGGGDQFLQQLEAGQIQVSDFDQYRVMCWKDVKRPLEYRADGRVLKHREGDAQAIAIINERRDRAGLPRPLHVSETRLYLTGCHWAGVPGPLPDPDDLFELRSSRHQDGGVLGNDFSAWAHWQGLELDTYWVTNPYNFEIDFANNRAIVRSHVMSLRSQRWLRWMGHYLALCRKELGLDGYLLAAPKWQWTYYPLYYGTANQGDYAIRQQASPLMHLETNRHRRFFAADLELGWEPGDEAKEPPYHHDYWDWTCYEALLAWNDLPGRLRRLDPDGVILSTIHAWGHVNGPSAPTDLRALRDHQQVLGGTIGEAREWVESQLTEHTRLCDFVYPPGSLRGSRGRRRRRREMDDEDD